MKKIYNLMTALCIGASAFAQDAFWTPTAYRGAFPVTDNTPATDWTSGWANFDPENTVYPATVTTVSADITANTTWSGVVKLMNKVYVKNNTFVYRSSFFNLRKCSRYNSPVGRE